MATAPAPATGNGSKRPEGLRLDIVVPDDSMAHQRDRFTRWLALIAFSAIAFLLPTYFGALWGSFAGVPKLGFLIGLGGAAALLIPLLVRSLIANPEWTGYVSLNPLTGKNVPYGPGLHPAFFWEQRNKDGTYPLQVITKTFEIPVQTQTSQVIATGMFQYQVDLANIVNNVGIDESTVNEGYTGFIDNFLTSELSKKTTEQARTSTDDINTLLGNQFMGDDTGEGGVPAFETKNGIRTVAVAITGLRLPPAVQKTRDAVDESEKVFASMAKLKGVTPEELAAMIKDKSLSKQEEGELRRAALATSDNAEMKIFEGNLANLGAVGEAIGNSGNGKKKH